MRCLKSLTLRVCEIIYQFLHVLCVDIFSVDQICVSSSIYAGATRVMGDSSDLNQYYICNCFISGNYFDQDDPNDYYNWELSQYLGIILTMAEMLQLSTSGETGERPTVTLEGGGPG